LVSRLWKLTPDFIKLDQALIRQAEDNPRLAKTLLGLVRIIKDIGAEPIITGIETQVQLDIALQTGASLIQGYLLGEPASVKNLQSSNLVKRL
jgi:EAL domain-containing protein (putative c-di-GMP-specific phosphodiesterase class I)